MKGLNKIGVRDGTLLLTLTLAMAAGVYALGVFSLSLAIDLFGWAGDEMMVMVKTFLVFNALVILRDAPVFARVIAEAFQAGKAPVAA